MNKFQKILLKILNAKDDSNFEFSEMLFLLKNLSFNLRTKGSHHIFYKEGVREIINLQLDKNNKCKLYQVKQVRQLILLYKLGELPNV